MNVIKEIREYIKSKAREINGRIIENDQAHTPDTVGQFKFDQSYFVRFLSAPVTPGQSYHSYNFAVEIEIAAKAGANVLESHDKIFCDAIALSATLVDKQDYGDKFNRVEITNLLPGPIEGNQRWTKVTISANFITFIKDGI